MKRIYETILYDPMEKKMAKIFKSLSASFTNYLIYIANLLYYLKRFKLILTKSSYFIDRPIQILN